MEISRKQKWFSLTLLSIIVPVSLLATFRLTGILKEPITISQTITLESKEWEIERPNQTTSIEEDIATSYADDALTATMLVRIGVYVDTSAFVSRFDYMDVTVAIDLATTVPSCFIESIYVVFWEDWPASKLDWLRTSFEFENLSLMNLIDGMKPYIRLTGINHPSNAQFKTEAVWTFLTPKNQSHHIKAAYEITYYDGTTYKKIVQPFLLNIIVGTEENE
jgi:hypothetical protein